MVAIKHTSKAKPIVSNALTKAERTSERKARIAGNFQIKEVSSSVSATFTILKTDRGIVTKEFFPGDNGECVKKSTPNFSGGSYDVRIVRSLSEFAAIRGSLAPDQVLMYSTPINGTLAGVITTKKRMSENKVSRSNDCFQHPTGGAILTGDYDPASATRPLTREQLGDTLNLAVPALSTTQWLWATSAGSCIHDTVTGKEHIGVSGQRIYFMVTDGRDINRSIHVIAERLWLAGHGRIKVSKSGAKLKRTLVDSAMANAVQPDFAAGAVCYPPFEQRSQQRLIGSGAPLDTANAIPDLTMTETEQLEKIYALAEQGAEAESQAARALWLIEYGERAVRHAVACGKTLSETEVAEIRANAIAALDSGILTGDFLIMLADRTEVTVAEILDNPDRFHRVLCLDPLEPEYDDYRVVGMIFTSNNPSVHSYAHGEQTFRLVRDKSDIHKLNDGTRAVSRIVRGIKSEYAPTYVSIPAAKKRLRDFINRVL